MCTVLLEGKKVRQGLPGAFQPHLQRVGLCARLSGARDTLQPAEQGQPRGCVLAGLICPRWAQGADGFAWPCNRPGGAQS